MTELAAKQTAIHSIRVTVKFDSDLKPQYRFTHYTWSHDNCMWVAVSGTQIVDTRPEIDDWLRSIGLVQVGRYTPVSNGSNTYEADLMEMS